MRSRTIHAPLVAFIATLLAAVAVQALGDQAPFVGPAGWTPVKPPKGMLGVWVHPGDSDFRQNIVVGAEKTQLSASQYDKRTLSQLSSGLTGFRLGADQDTTTCGGQPAHYISYASILNGREVLYEHMSTMIGGVAWFAIYTRLMTQPSLPEARQALTTLCGYKPGEGLPPQATQPPSETQATPTPASEPTAPPPSPYATLEPFDR